MNTLMPPMISLIEEDAVIVSVDIECHCRNETRGEYFQGIKTNKRRVCEIGFAVLDTRRVRDIHPGDRFINAWDKFGAYNLAIIENRHDTKKHAPWCKVGDANDFEFGKTRWVHSYNVKKVFMNKIKKYVGGNPTSPGHRKGRPIIWLFFGGANDKIWLSELDLVLMREFPNSQVIDIQTGSLATDLAERLQKPRCSAKDLFHHLGIPTSKTHNGGNDAVYELKAWLASLTLTQEQRTSLLYSGPLDPPRPKLDKDIGDHGALADVEPTDADSTYVQTAASTAASGQSLQGSKSYASAVLQAGSTKRVPTSNAAPVLARQNIDTPALSSTSSQTATPSGADTPSASFATTPGIRSVSTSPEEIPTTLPVSTFPSKRGKGNRKSQQL